MDNILAKVYEALVKYSIEYDNTIHFIPIKNTTFVSVYSNNRFITYINLNDNILNGNVYIAPSISKINQINKPENFQMIAMIPINYNEFEIKNCINSLLCQQPISPRIILFT